MKISVLSDTHGFYHPDLNRLFQGTDFILHAGDIGNEAIIDELEKIAPVHAVCGNSDDYPLKIMYPSQKLITLGNYRFLLLHMFDELRAKDRQWIHKLAPLDFIVCGHTHQRSLRNYENIRIVNPGSASRNGRLEAPGVGIIYLEKEIWVEFRTFDG